MAPDTDRIRKQVLLRATPDRVWRAISDAKEFGTWFGMALEGPFVAGTSVVGRIRPTVVDPEVAKGQKAFEGVSFRIYVERIEPPRLLAFRWHPGAVDPKVDYEKEPTTLVEFLLAPHADGTMLTITESGFDALPPARRATAFEGNEGGWTIQLQLVAKYLALHP